MLFAKMAQTSWSFNCFNTELKKSDLKEKKKENIPRYAAVSAVTRYAVTAFTNNQSDSKTVLDYLALGGEKLFWTTIRFWETYHPPLP